MSMPHWLYQHEKLPWCEAKWSPLQGSRGTLLWKHNSVERCPTSSVAGVWDVGDLGSKPSSAWGGSNSHLSPLQGQLMYFTLNRHCIQTQTGPQAEIGTQASPPSDDCLSQCVRKSSSLFLFFISHAKWKSFIRKSGRCYLFLCLVPDHSVAWPLVSSPER